VDIVNYLGIDVDVDNVMIADHTIKTSTRDKDNELDRV